MSKRSRGSQPYLIRLASALDARVSGALYHEWHGRGFIREIGFKLAKAASGYFARLDADGHVYIEQFETELPIRIPITNYEAIALYAIWTPFLTALQRQWEVQAQYGGLRSMKNELRIGMDLGRFIFQPAQPLEPSISAARAGMDAPQVAELRNLQLDTCHAPSLQNLHS